MLTQSSIILRVSFFLYTSPVRHIIYAHSLQTIVKTLVRVIVIRSSDYILYSTLLIHILQVLELDRSVCLLHAFHAVRKFSVTVRSLNLLDACNSQNNFADFAQLFAHFRPISYRVRAVCKVLAGSALSAKFLPSARAFRKCANSA